MMNAVGGQPLIAPDLECSPLIDLPCEIWRIILKKIPQKGALNLRLVNKDFKEKVNNLYEDWKIRLDEKSPFLEMILNLRVKEVEIYSLLNSPSFRPPGVLFKYPDRIQKLTLDSFSSNHNAHVLLQSKNLKWISLKLNKNTEPFEALPIGYNYPELHTLEIEIVTDEKEEGEFLEPGTLFQRVMMSSTMPKLKSFYFSHNSDSNKATIYNCSSVLISSLSRHGQNLQHFHYSSWISRRNSFGVFPTFDDAIILNNMTSLETLKFNYNCNVDPLHKTWRRLIQNQQNLVDLELGYRFGISSTCLREIVAKNFQTLTSVEIDRWTFEEGRRGGVFDASIFEACHSLTRLEVIPDNRNDYKVNNLSSLPTQIKTLWLPRFGADSGDILNFLSGHSVLSFLYIRSGGNLPVLEAVLSHDALLTARIERGIEVPTSPSEIVRLHEIFDVLEYRYVGAQYGFRYIFLKRASVIANWKNVLL